MDRGKGFDRQKAATKARARAGKKPRASLRPISDKRRRALNFYEDEVASIVGRIGLRWCEVYVAHECRGTIETHHVVKRSAGGDHHRSNLLRLCRSAHDFTDESAGGRRGHLVIEALGAERFRQHVERYTRYTGGVRIFHEPAVTYARAKEGTPCQPGQSPNDT